MYYTPLQFLSNKLVGFQLIACIYKQIGKNIVDPDQLASENMLRASPEGLCCVLLQDALS